uniref:DNA topoisomerase I n=1 Tax=Albugo laibachii Nc14 TaxID=890382 RepID=F0WN99_9STRA|nr:DNA topoisomerase putative [Albugo laibachii Nc14]|eukprot:CCA22788.1 DNA topoisomerase putative [Albugo laibachii Nc14]
MDCGSSDEDDLIPISQLRNRKQQQKKINTQVEAVETKAQPIVTRIKRKASATERVKETERWISDQDSDDSDDDIPISQLKSSKKQKTTKTVKKETVQKRKICSKEKSTTKSSKKPKREVKVQIKTEVTRKSVHKLKVHSKAERLDMAIKAYRWWKAEELPEGIQWRTLEHNGVFFPPAYFPHGIPLLYQGKSVELTPAQEEVVSFYAAIPPDGPQLGNPKTRKIFNQNFFQDLQKLLGKNHTIKKFDLCDFSLIRQHLDVAREEKKNRSKEEKQLEKERKELEQFTNGFAIVDGHLEKVGNYRIEPPGLFRGRGEHPKTGTLKERVLPEEVTVNVGISDRVPICNMPGHAWKEVIHRDTVSWLAYWNENVMGGIKYVWLAASSSFKGKSDMIKYEKARQLKKHIDRIRKDYTSGLKAKDRSTQQRSTAMWVIDVLALRVGNEKGEDEADTVGCCSLRVEHMSFNDDNCELTLAFLGKDSMPYNNTVTLAQYGQVGKQVYSNLKLFCHKKSKNDQVFDELATSDLNKHLSSLMPGLTAKVFRTFNASVTLEKELPYALDPDGKLETNVKVVAYNDANREVAILCNHQRTVPKSFDNTLEKMTAQLDQLKEQLQDLKKMQVLIQSGKSMSIQLKQSTANENGDEKEDQKDLKDLLAKKAQNHLFPKTPSLEQVKKRTEAWKKKMNTLAIRLQDKSDNKQVALGTSKINYMDPRISVAWCKRNEVPISAVFAKTLREKFVWAMDAAPDWKF